MRVFAVCCACLVGCGGGAATNAPAMPVPTANPAPALGPEPVGAPSQLGGAWLDEVHDRFHARWADTFVEQSRLYLPAGHPLNDPRLEAVLRFAVAPDGTVHDVETVRSSGVGDFDAAARELVTENGAAAPLPPPPENLRSDDGSVHVTWRFARDARLDGTAGAKIERITWEPGRAVPALIVAGRSDEAADRAADALEAAADPNAVAAALPLARRVAAAVLTDAVEAEKDPALRVAAAAGLAAARWSDAVPLLRRTAREANDLGLMAAALRALGDLGDDADVPLLLEVVEQAHDERSAAAAGALVKLGKGSELWARLAPAAGGTDPAQRAWALGDLVEAPLEASTTALVEALGDRTRARAERAAAARALGALAGDAAGPAAQALASALTDGDAAIRAAAAGGLGRAAEERGLRAAALAKKVLPLLRDRDPRVSAEAARAAALLDGRTAARDVSARAARGDLAAIAALGTIEGPAAPAQLQKLAASKVLEVRAAALQALARRAEPEARAQVAALALDVDPRLRALAVGVSEDETTVRAALGDPVPEVRAAAVAPLWRLVGAGKAAVPVLRALADADDPRARVLLARELLIASRGP